MKKILNIWLFAALVSGLSLSITSCKDDDDDNGGNGIDPGLVKDATDTEEAKDAYNWLVNMTDIVEFTDDWASKTYEPTIGVESKNEANTRLVVVADISHAKMNFSSISGIKVSALSSTQSQTIDGVGTLTWTPSAAGANNLATVDVNTKLIPHLSKIVYCTTEQIGDNIGGAYEGTAYYRFGDVIEDTEGYYWVCVKPAFGTGSAAQQQGYWINIINRNPINGKSKNGTGPVPDIPTKNIRDDWNEIEKYNGNTILLPTKLNSTKEQVHNLSNLIWALLDPEGYQAGVGDDGIGLGGYDYKYNGKKFCLRVAEQWEEKNIWQKLFNRSYAQMKDMKKLNFFYEGYRWASGHTGRVTLQTTDKYSTEFLTEFDEDKNNNYEMKEEGSGFDIRRYCSDPEQNASCAKSGKAGYAPKEQFPASGEEGYWVVRQKSSSEMVGTSNLNHPSVYVSLNNTAEIYRYNQVYSKFVGKDTPVEEEDELVNINPFKNRGYYSVGDVVKDESKNRWICMEVSSFGSEKSSDQNNYAYFVSFDGDAMGGSNAKNLPKKDLAAQMLFHISYLYQKALKTIKTPKSLEQKRLAHIEEHAEVNIMDLVALRDTLFKNSKNETKSISNLFTSVVYYDEGEKDFCVLRLMLDNTVEYKGDSDFAWRFWDSYSADLESQMLLDDVFDKRMIRLFADDPWVYLPWHNPETDKQVASTGKRKPEAADELSGGVLWYTYRHGYNIFNHQMPTNMYNEPLYLIAVKRVKDVGKPASSFEDGTSFEPVSLVRDALGEEFLEVAEDVPNVDNLRMIYDAYLSTDNITLNGKRYDFKFTNKP